MDRKKVSKKCRSSWPLFLGEGGHVSSPSTQSRPDQVLDMLIRFFAQFCSIQFVDKTSLDNSRITSCVSKKGVDTMNGFLGDN